VWIPGVGGTADSVAACVTEGDIKAVRLHETQAYFRTLHVIKCMVRAHLLTVT